MKNLRVSRRKEIIETRAEIHKKETKETIAKINKTKSRFFDKINKIHKQLARLIKKKRLKSTKLEMKMEKSQQTTQKYKDLRRLLSTTICQKWTTWKKWMNS